MAMPIGHSSAILIRLAYIAGEKGDGPMRPAVGVAFLLLVGSSVQGEEGTTYTCTKHTLHECLLELPCEALKREPGGDIVVPSGVKIRLADTLDQGEFNQRDFNRAAEKKCGKMQ